jgi:hypothetical protein
MNYWRFCCHIYISGHIKPSIRHSSSESERLYRLWARDKGPSCDIWKRGAAPGGSLLGLSWNEELWNMGKVEFQSILPA